MDGKRQKTQGNLASGLESRGETPKSNQGGSEPSAAKPETESPATMERLMEEVVQRENLNEAYRRVVQNGGSPGTDGMTVKELHGHLRAHGPEILRGLLEGTYKPAPVRRVEIPKPGGGMRKLGIPTVTDRFVQQALLQVLQRIWDPTFSESSFGFRPGHSAHQAVAQAQQHIVAGYRWVVDIDLEKFFDRVNHDALMGRVAKRVKDKRVLKLIRAFLNAGVMENGLVSPTEEGTPQGGPLSPLLSNIMLDDLDRELEKRGHRFVRYADDCNVYVRSERSGQRVMEGLRRYITKRLKLKINESKSAVARPPERKFLGFSFTSEQEPRRRIAPKALERCRERIRELTYRTRAVRLDEMVKDLRRYLRGWIGYFGFCETPTDLRHLASWIRRRLRCVVWKQWKEGRRRSAELRRRGVNSDLAARTAGSPHGPWRLSLSPALHFAFPDAYFDSLGLPLLRCS